jgi:hypothetical protein
MQSMEQMNRGHFVLLGSTTNDSDESWRMRGTDDKVSRVNYTSDPNRTGNCLEPREDTWRRHVYQHALAIQVSRVSGTPKRRLYGLWRTTRDELEGSWSNRDTITVFGWTD